ncbi:hypothetical protein FVO59_10550 [Microbacterium esteraromaticum]|uniref:GerMN domain-containing protein n=1 Tax=Microbacterium esteraromaticum TaxID=57043 RepID=A0A7D8AM59_9MICO|nr:hypothetical protein [Microbacterium esteraromaticum]QMU97608.1 hypothetical protein FVO59_10550 [Microbacterium esteraromaticum]
MTMTTTLLRAVSALAAAGLLVGMLSACSPEAEPTSEPTKTAAFATDEEAFAAAEETYRAFIHAQNQVDLDDASTFEPVFRLTVADANTAVRESLSQLSAENVTMRGESSVASVEPLDVDLSIGTISMHICVDVSETELVGLDGESLVPPDRADLQSLLVDFVTQEAGDVKVSRTVGAEKPCRQ